MLDNLDKLQQAANNGDSKAWAEEMKKTGDNQFADMAAALNDFFNGN